MKYFQIIILLLLTTRITAQDGETVRWINKNLIEIEDSNPDSELEKFDQNKPEKFANARIFGFGEASHHGREFFEIKAKFFKYLVRSQNVKTFIIEDDYTAEKGINEWIGGGEGDIQTIANNFTQRAWNNKEVVKLLQWMRNYNLDKPQKDQIRFYGMDIQNVDKINLEIREFVRDYNVPVSEELLAVVDSCAQKKIDYSKSSNWSDIQTPKLKKLNKIILDFQSNSLNQKKEEFQSIIRALNYLINYTFYVQHSKSEIRDLKMFENVKWIVERESPNQKAFIWAHNEHINNKEMKFYGSGRINLGAHLKEYYQEDYYSVYFDFGIGQVIGLVVRKNKPNYWDIYEIDKPFRNTYAKTLFEVKEDFYFIDMEKALKNSEVRSFFSDEKKQLYLGGPGYDPKDKTLFDKKYSEMFDGLIFIKKLSVPNYNLNST